MAVKNVNVYDTAFCGEWDKLLTAIARVECLHPQSKTGRGSHKGTK